MNSLNSKSNSPILLRTIFLGIFWLIYGNSLIASELNVYYSNPVVAELENQQLRIDDLRNKKIYDLSLELYKHLQEQLIQHTLKQLEGKYEEITSNPEVSISEKQILRFYQANKLKNRGTLEQFRPQIQEYLIKQIRQEKKLAQYGMALEKGWVKSYLNPPSEYIVRAQIKTAFIRGNPKATVMVLEFSDYQCPYCSRIQSTIETLIKKYQKQVAFGYRHFPLAFHTEADEAAIAVECAREQDKFNDMHKILYTHQKALSQEDLKNYARKIGVKNFKKFENCLDTEYYRGLVNQDLEDGASLGVTGTPGFFIGHYNANSRTIQGELLSGAQPLNTFEKLISKYLSKN